MNAIQSYKEGSEQLREAIKTLRSNICFEALNRPIRSIAVVSADEGDGKSTVAAYLAVAMAEMGKRTLLVEGNCRKPAVCSLFGLGSLTDWSEFIINSDKNKEIEGYILSTEQKGLYVLDGPAHADYAVEAIGSKQFEALMSMLSEKFDIVIYDTPALKGYIDAALIASRTDGTVLVIGADKTESKDVKSATEQLARAKANVLGAVLNNVCSVK